MTANANTVNDFHRVSLTNSAVPTERVLIEVTPELVETRNVNYKTVDPIHAPGQIFSYVNSTARTFNISSIKLVSRTREEAEKNLLYLWYLRSWTVPQFGQLYGNGVRQNRQIYQNALKQDGLSEEAKRKLIQDLQATEIAYDNRGAPPAVLYLSAYSPDSYYEKQMAHISRVPVVIQNLSIPYPADTDYFPSISGIPMPTLFTIDMTLAETHSPFEYENFSLSDFKKGILRNF